ncbi:MAG: Na/Pi cotransporter family protein [Proteobacteria bacterium]|nr:Na/Pi cotransporter family protein [Pseudomonadota bacterium]
MNDYLDIWKLFAGLGLFLFAMNNLEAALKQLAGRRFRRFLRYSTDKPVRSAAGGIIATTIVQSSSLVSLIVLAFVGAGLIPLVNAIGIVLGSNLGTTFTGWVVATLGFKLDLTTFIYPLAAAGGLSYGLTKRHWKSFSQLILSFALLLMGLDFMKGSVGALTEHIDINILSDYPLIVFLFAGVIFTAVIQSSSATMMLTLSALYAGIIPLPAAVSLIIGADLGTTSTVLLGSMHGAAAKRRLAMAHVLFNLTIATLAFIGLFPLLALIELLTIDDPLYSLVAFHSLFNLFGLLMFLPLIKQFSHFLEHWIKEDEQHIERFIHNVPASVTDAALIALEKESRYLLYLVIRLNLRYLRISPKTAGVADSEFHLPTALASSSKLEHYIAIKKLEGEIVRYALKIKTDDSDADTDTVKDDGLTQKIDNLINAVRSGVYSAKSLKNIDEDLKSFYVIDDDTVSKYFEVLKEPVHSIYEPMVRLLSDAKDVDYIEEELLLLKEKSQDFHHEFSSKLYKKMSGIHLKSLDLSTLLNVNKEIETSEKAMIKALSLL